MVHSGLKASIPTEQDDAMTRHTPGPWSVPHFAEPSTGCECEYVLTDGYMGAVCTVHASGEGGCIETGDNPRFAEAVANAHLIAAAPDLLEALNELLFEDSDKSDMDRIVTRLRARAAIAKATGAASAPAMGTERSGVNQA